MITRNGATTPPTKPEPESVFNAKEIVQILQGLMTKVTATEVTPATVQAACQCSAQISQLLRLHLDVERLRRSQKE